MSSYEKIRGGKLSFKGDINKDKKKKKKKTKNASVLEGTEGKDAQGAAEFATQEGETPSGGADEKNPEDDGTVLVFGSTLHRVKKKEGDHGIDHTNPGQTYETIFHYETQRAKDAKGRHLCFGTNYRSAPEILHGYDRKVKGRTSEERLDMRCGQKADKYCK